MNVQNTVSDVLLFVGAFASASAAFLAAMSALEQTLATVTGRISSQTLGGVISGGETVLFIVGFTLLLIGILHTGRKLLFR